MKTFKSPRAKLNRIPSRGYYDEETIFDILDAGFLCHVAFYMDGSPHLIPTAYGRKGKTVFLHGSAKSRMLCHLATGAPAAIAVTHIDGIVLARSSFHSSMNYRSAVLYGSGMEITETQEKMEALEIVSESIMPGRWEEARKPTTNELTATTVVAFHIEEGSAKIRTGPPSDDTADELLDIWAGVLPVAPAYGDAIRDANLRDHIGFPKSLENFVDKHNRFRKSID